jgi:hypothetical protein
MWPPANFLTDDAIGSGATAESRTSTAADSGTTPLSRQRLGPSRDTDRIATLSGSTLTL